MTTLRELTRHRPFGLRTHARDEWLDRPVEWATITELADLRHWLRGGEVVLTTGMTLTTAARQEAFVAMLAEAGAAALGFGLGLTHTTVPAAIVAACEHAGLPLLDVPYETPFAGITRWVADAAARGNVDRLNDLLRMHDELAAHLLGGNGLTGLVEELHRALDTPVAVVDQQGHVRANAPAHEFWPTSEIRRLLRTHRDPTVAELLEGGRQQVHLLPINVDGQPVAALVTGAVTAQDEIAGRLLRFGVNLIGLELRRQHAVHRGRHDQAGQVLEDVVRSVLSPAEAARRLDAIGLSPVSGHRVLLGSTDAGLDALDSLPSPLLGPEIDATGAVVAAYVDHYFVLVCPTEEMTVEAAPVVLAALRNRGRDAAVGIGGSYTGVEGLRWSYLEARDALARGPGIHQGDPLTLQRLLTANPDLPVRELARASLGALLDHDARANDAHLVRTLVTYLSLDGSAQATADALFVHRNTVHYRLAKIEALTGASLASTRDRVQLWLALSALGHPVDSVDGRRYPQRIPKE